MHAACSSHQEKPISFLNMITMPRLRFYGNGLMTRINVVNGWQAKLFPSCVYADEAARELSVRLGRAPTESEVAGELGVPVERWRRMSMELRNTGLVSSSGPSNSDHERDLAEECPGAPDLRPDRMCERAQLRTTLNRAIGTLPKRYQKVVFLYYTSDMTMKEIGDVLGVNESRVSQIHKTALKKMAAALESEGIRSPAAL